MKQFYILFLCIILSSCENPNPNNSYDNEEGTSVNVVVTQKPVGLDLQALGEIAKKSSNAKDFEQKLNAPGSINNVDLDGDGNVDYLNVTEYGDADNRGFSVTDIFKNTTTGNTDTQEIASIQFSKQANQVTTNISGNQTIYGANSNYQTTNLLTELILFNYLFTPHSYYYSPYRYGYYPSYYHSYHPVPYTTYNRTVTTYTTKTTFKSAPAPVSKIKDPNARKSSPTVQRSYSSPTKSQKSFSVRDNSKPVNNGGFKSSNSSSNKSGSSYRSSSSPSSSRIGRR